MHTTRRSKWALCPWAAVVALTGGAVTAQTGSTTTCPTPVVGEELRSLPALQAKGGMLSTVFTIQEKTQCVPVETTDASGNTTYTAQPMSLRTYVYPDPQSGKLQWGYPGPTLVVRKPDKPGGQGDGWTIRLVNDLEPQDHKATCDSACPATTVCPTDTSQLPDPAACGKTLNPLCCCWVDVQQTYPDCFHGDNSTNLHFHGTHVSPQPPQDYVLLELRPKPKSGPVPATASGTHGPHGRGIVAYGEYTYQVDPLAYNQAEGTHWYHPHKHGSVSLQVANGMPGALLIRGPFDDWLAGYYAKQGQELTEKLLVMQQIQQTTNLFIPGAPAPPVLVNGQVSPTITMQPGEVQRWRFVNATMQAAAQLSVYFPEGATVKQIAMDGVRFAPENYSRQPLFDPANPTQFTISPGNRADFLVQAPGTETTLQVGHEVFREPALSEHSRARVRRRDEALAPGPPRAPLVRLRVKKATPPAAGGEASPAYATGLPPADQWPPMPDYLQDIKPSEIVGTENLTFSMTDKEGKQTGPGNPAAMFFINGIQYDDDCVNVTTKLDTAEKWIIQNTSPLAHPFHIHINPFQVIDDGTTKYSPPYVWQDTLALAVGTPGKPGQVELWHKYKDFTGEYVLHCHFLGHEDRGMMFNVQTVCKDDPTKWGKSTLDEAPECVPGNLIPASPTCPAPAAAAASSASE
jgi:FtsP/CotA-like multicopper oxidase with cupredoxin domain